GALVTVDRLVYLGAMLAPLAFLPLLGGWDIVGALPALAQNLLSADPILYNFRAQYQAFVLPFLLPAAVGGYARLERRRPGHWPVTVLAVALVISLALDSRTMNNLAPARFRPTEAQRAAYRVLAAVPPGAVVSAQDPYVAHLSLRPLVFVFPVGIEKSDHVLVDGATYPWSNLPSTTMAREGNRVTIVSDGTEYRDAAADPAAARLASASGSGQRDVVVLADALQHQEDHRGLPAVGHQVGPARLDGVGLAGVEADALLGD